MLINLLQRHHLWLFIFLSGLGGLALGNLTATTIEMLATPAPQIRQIQQQPTTRPLAQPRLSDFHSILEKDIFNSGGRTQELDQRTPSKTAQAKPAPVASKWTLIGTVSGGESPLATLKNNKTVSTYHLHEKLPDAATLNRVERNLVGLEYPDGHTQTLKLEQPPRAPSSIKKPRVSRRGNDVQQVENLGENRWEIPAQVAKNARSNIGTLLSQAQAIPYLEGKQTTGFQIRMIKSGSLIAQLGLKKGDILREINGLPLNSPEKALQIFGQLRQARQVSISLERAGTPMTFTYEIR